MRPERATIDIVPHDDHFLVLICRAPRGAWDELAPDFAFVLRTVEFDPQAVSPTMQGPLRDQQGNGPKARTGRRDALPTVRIKG